MFENLVVLNRKPENDFELSSQSQNWHSWQTCVRKVFFGHASNLDAIKVYPDDQIYSGDEAYKFCMEVICGLHSPIPGETEVFGQFKQFVEKHKKYLQHQPELKKLFLAMITDAKAVRQNHLINLGSQSYGSVVRRKVKTRQLHEVNLLGAGLLVKDILPWLIKLDIKIRVHCRNTEKSHTLLNDFPDISIEDINKPRASALEGALVVAAPLNANIITNWLGSDSKKLDIILDLRGDSHIDHVFTQCPVESLSHLFNEIKETQQKLKKKVNSAKSMIDSLINEKQNAVQLRPNGWYDIF